MAATVGQGSASRRSNDLLAAADERVARGLVGEAGELADVGAGDEADLLARDEDEAAGRLALEAFQQRLELGEHATPERTLAEVPGLSSVSQAMPSASARVVQEPGVGSFMGDAPGEGSLQAAETLRSAARGVHLEVAHQRAVVREAHVRHAEVGDLDALAHQHEVELDARHARRKGGQARGVGAAQPRGAHEQVDLVRAPEGVEVPGDDHRLLGLQDQVMQRAQLILPVAELQRQVHQEHAHLGELELDDEPLDAGVEVVEALPVHGGGGQEGVALLAHDRHELVERVRAVLGLVGRVVAELAGDVVGLVEHAGADRAGVDLDQADDVGLSARMNSVMPLSTLRLLRR